MMGGEPAAEPYFLGVEGGGTRTVALLADGRGKILQRFESGPLNLKLLSDAGVLRRLRGIKRGLTVRPSSLAICFAGCRTSADHARARALTARVWPRVPAYVGSDLDSGFAAAFGPNESGIAVISGTGSCVYGRNGEQTA